MQARLIKQSTFVVALFVTLLSSQAMAETTSKESQTLLEVMLDMGKEMQHITSAISSEDWTQVEESAAWISTHPKPAKSQRMRIMKFLGGEIAQFKDSDMKTHAAARELAKMARTQDGRAVISAFSTLQNTCLTCHERYRKRLQDHFYGQR